MTQGHCHFDHVGYDLVTLVAMIMSDILSFRTYLGQVMHAAAHLSFKLKSFYHLTLKGPGFFVYLKSGGGGGGADSAPPPPPQISAAERRKILKFGTYVELVNTYVLTKLQC